MEGWVLDVYPDYSRDLLIVWLKDWHGKVHKLADLFEPSFYVGGEKARLTRLAERLFGHEGVSSLTYEGGKRLLDGTVPRNLLEVGLRKFSALRELPKEIIAEGEFRDLQLYDVDIDLPLCYMTARGISPLARLEAERTLDGVRYSLLEDPAALDYEPPALRVGSLDVEAAKRGIVATIEDPLRRVTLGIGGQDEVFEGDEVGALADLSKALHGADPDVLYASSATLSYLCHRATAHGLEEFSLGRDRRVRPLPRREGKSYFSYGRVLYKAPATFLRGRLHVDPGSFLFSESGWHGLVDLARLSGISLQRLGRMSPGNAITTLHLRYALESGILVPWKVQNPERFKTARALLAADRGGYIFDPKVGLHEDVAELDFSSMYPNIMRRFNISPETVLCGCCSSSATKVPALGYHICERKTGLIPSVIGPVIDRRQALKRRIRSAEGPELEALRQRQAVLKWLLVTSFGYMGYRNARFGRIECHEAICAYGREILLKVKEMVEFFGFEVVHGIVDSVWVKRRATQDELEELCGLISAEIGIPMNLEGRYRWVVFLPARGTGVGALNRYYGLFENGEVKARGTELRMRDTPGLIREYQEEVLAVLSRARDAEEFHVCLPEAFSVLRRSIARVRAGDVPPEDLVFTVRTSRGLRDYRQRNLVSAALKQYHLEGVEVSPGQSIRYIVTDHRARCHVDRVKIAEAVGEGDRYDTEFYVGHLIRATESLFLPFGFTGERIRGALSEGKQTTLIRYAM